MADRRAAHSGPRTAFRGRRAARAGRRRDRLRGGARGLPALAPPVLRARRRDRALGDRPAAGRPLSALSRAARDRSARARAPGDGAGAARALDAAIVAYPHAAAAPTVAALLERGVRVVDLSADFRLRDAADLRAVVRRASAPRPARRGCLRADRAAPRADRRGALVASPGCFPTAAILALAPLARAGLIADVVIDAKPGISGAGRASTDHPLRRWPARTSLPTASRSHRHTPEIEQELAPARRRAAGPVQAASRAARPGRAADLLRDADAHGRSRGAARAVRGRLRRRAVHRAARAPARHARACARRTSAGSTPPPTGTRARSSCSRDRQPLEGDLVAGDRRTST